jgi:hypothetical protein
MLGRKDFTQEELDAARAMVHGELAAYRRLAGAINGNAAAAAALAELEAPLCNSLMLALDRFFVHRIRPVTGKDGNPLNEVELLAEGLILHGGVLRESRVLKLVPEDSVSKIGYGERIELTADRLERIADAFLAELEARFVQTA